MGLYHRRLVLPPLSGSAMSGNGHRGAAGAENLAAGIVDSQYIDGCRGDPPGGAAPRQLQVRSSHVRGEM